MSAPASRDLAHLVDDDLGAQLAAVLGGRERDHLQVGMGAGLDQVRAAVVRCGFALGVALLRQHAARQAVHHRALAQPCRAADQQAMAEAAGLQRSDRMIVRALLPGENSVLMPGRCPSAYADKR